MAMSESTFNGYLAKILSARYGEEVRGSIHDSLQGMYEIVKQNTLDVSAASQMMAAVDSLNKIKTDATNAANAANTAATNLNRLKTEASNAASAANTAASNANKAVSDANSAVKKANDAAAAANNAVLAAQSATSNANAAASKATTATSKANTAASNADEATSKANIATSKAGEATSAANNAADKANTAASNATTATSKANTATSKAEEATRNANNAASNANTAVFNANEAASFADSATSRADAAAASANSAAESVNKAKTDAEDAADKANTAASKAGEATSAANNATSRANAATNRANDAAAIIETLEVGDINTGNIATKDYVGKQIDGIEIGGRNYLLGTNQGIANWFWSFGNNDNTATFTEATYYGRRGVKIVRNESTDTTGWSVLMYKNVNLIGLIEDEDYTFSMYIRTNKDLSDLNFGIKNSGSKNTILETDVPLPAIISGPEFVKVSVNVHTKKDLPALGDQLVYIPVGARGQNSSGATIEIFDAKLERGNKATDWSPAPEDADRAISRRATVTYDYGGRNLKEIFGTADALHAALEAEDYSHIAVGDYWPITLNGKFWDWGSYAIPPHTQDYRTPELTNAHVGTGDLYREGQYVSDTAVGFYYNGESIMYYVKSSDCTPYIERTFANVTVKLEVAGINHYWRYGDSGDLAGSKPHIVFVSRDCLPFSMRMRKANTKWEYETATNPWLGSAMYKTLNDEKHGVLPLVAATDVGTYIYAGPNGKGMCALMETKAPDTANATGWAWYDRGKLFLPSVSEVWGDHFWVDANREAGLGNQFAIFRDSRRHISKGIGNNGSRVTWSLSPTSNDNKTNFAHVNADGRASTSNAASMIPVPVCFIFV